MGTHSAVSHATSFVDLSGTCSATNGNWTQVDAADVRRGFFRVSNPNASANLFVWDKVGTPTNGVTNNGVKIPPGQAYVWDVKNTNTAIYVASDTSSANFEAAKG